MKTPLAWHNLWQNKVRTGVATLGVAFAVLLVFMQWGFYDSVRETAVLMLRHFDFDILVVSKRYRRMTLPASFPRDRLLQARTVPGVANAVPVYVGFNLWRTPQDGAAERFVGRRQRTLILGVDPRDAVFQNLPQVERQLPQLQRPYTALMDQASREAFGPVQPGIVTDVGNQRIEVVDTFTLGTGFAANGQLVVSDETFSRLFYRPLSEVAIGLIQLDPQAKQELGLAKIRASLQERLPQGDVRVVTREQIEADEIDFWVQKTSVGQVFAIGLMIAVIVGISIVYQVLSADVSARLHEYATLKAMGYAPRFLSLVVMQQALWLGVFGFVPGFLASYGLYWATRQMVQIPIYMSVDKAVVVFVLSLAMCGLSGMIAVRKVHAADPADLF